LVLGLLVLGLLVLADLVVRLFVRPDIGVRA